MPRCSHASADRPAAQRIWDLDEARLSGNPEWDIRADWIDYEAAGATGPDDLITAIRPVLDATMLSQDIIDLALRSSIDPERHPGAGRAHRRAALRAARTARSRKASAAWSCRSSPEPTIREATIGENLRFGTAKGPALADKALSANPYIMSVLKEVGLDETLYDMGLEIASNAIELFADLPPDNPLFQQLTFMTPEEIPDYQILLQRLQGRQVRRAPRSTTARRSSR